MSTELAPHSSPPERRSGFRFPVALTLSYRGHRGKHEVEGQGKTVDMSSSGILFIAEHVLPEGSGVEITLQWPYLLDDSIPLQLKVSAKVMRCEGTRAAVGIVSHEFRTAGRSSPPKANGSAAASKPPTRLRNW